MPWATDPADTLGYWFTGLIHPSPGDSGHITSFAQDVHRAFLSCYWYSAILPGVEGYDECSIYGRDEVDVSAAAVLPSTGGDYFTVYLDVDDVPTEYTTGPRPIPHCADLYYYDPRKAYQSCPTNLDPPTLPVSATINGSATTGVKSTGAPNDTVMDYSFAAATGGTPPTSPQWLVNPSPITGDPNIDSSDPATTLLWTAAQLATASFGFQSTNSPYHMDGVFSGNFSVVGWHLITPVPPADNVAMIV